MREGHRRNDDDCGNGSEMRNLPVRRVLLIPASTEQACFHISLPFLVSKAGGKANGAFSARTLLPL